MSIQHTNMTLTFADVFHWQCFNRWASSHPATTAPAGYACPVCRGPVFPKPNQVSPVVTQLRGFLERANWARAGLGLDLVGFILKWAVAYMLTPYTVSYSNHYDVVDRCPMAQHLAPRADLCSSKAYYTRQCSGWLVCPNRQ